MGCFKTWCTRGVKYHRIPDPDVNEAVRDDGDQEVQVEAQTPLFDQKALSVDPRILTMKFGTRPDIGCIFKQVKDATVTQAEDGGSQATASTDQNCSTNKLPVVIACGPERLVEAVQWEARQKGLRVVGL